MSRERAWERYITDEDNVFHYNSTDEKIEEMKAIKNKILLLLMANCFSKKQKEIYNLNTVQGMTIEEISIKLNIAKSTVRVHLKNCSDKIKQWAEDLEKM